MEAATQAQAPAVVPAAARPAPSVRTLLGLAWPVVVSRASQVVIGVTDVIMTASLGQAAIAATATGALNAFSVMIFPMGVSFIVSTFSSQLYGKGDLPGARRYGWYGLGIALAAGVLSLASLPFVGRVLALFPYAPDVRALMTEYLRWRLLSCGAAVGIEALANYYGGLGNTRLPMVASVSAMALNVGFNWVFIFGHLGAPALGVRGAALANSLATTIAFAGLLARFLADGRRTARARPRLRELWRMLRFGIPTGLNWAFEFYAFNFFVNVVVAGLGTTSLAALNAVIQINAVSFMPAFGLASAGAILVGQAIGAGAKDEVPAIWRMTFRASAVWQGLVGLLYIAVPSVLLLTFSPSGAEGEAFRMVARRMLMLSAAWQLFDSAATSLAEALRAAGDTAFTMWARIVLAWAIFVPGSLVSVRVLGWGDLGAVFWLSFYMAMLAVVLYRRFHRGAWRKLDLVGTPAV
jgi:MATE family multidrug resistance protein